MTVEETVAVKETTASAEKIIDEDDTGIQKLKGKVSLFFRVRGFGFIRPAKEDEEDIMVRWENVVTDDPYPYIQPGTQVEYLTEKGKDGKVEAIEVTLEVLVPLT